MTTILAMPADQRWPRALTTLGVVLAALMWLYRDTMLGMVSIWSRSETFTHAFAVAPISLWLIWRRRTLLARMVPQPQPWWLLPMGLAVLAWLLGSLVSVNALMQFALVALLVMSVPAVLGWQVARAIRFPLLFLFFCVPFGEFLMPRLMEWTADFTVWALQLSGIPVLRDGLQFSIPSGHWSVEAACSGIRYLMASVMVGVLFAYLNYNSMWRRLAFIGASILAPIVANWLRAYLIVLIGHLSSNELATGADHLVYGWVFFGVVIMAMLAIGAYWAQPEVKPDLSLATVPASQTSMAQLALSAAAMVAVLALPHGLLARLDTPVRSQLPDLQGVGTPVAGWASTQEPLADWLNAYVNPTLRLQRNYAQGEHRVGLQLAYYAAETSDSKLLSSINALTPGKDSAWAVVRQGNQTVQVSGQALAWRTAELRDQRTIDARQGDGGRLIVWRTYWINGVFTTNEAWAKALLAFNRLAGRSSVGAVLMLYTAYTAPEQATATLDTFVRDQLQAIASQLQQAHELASPH